MKAFLTNILYSLAAILLLAACQQSSYTIKGKADIEGIDTLLLTYDMQTGEPSDTILVKDGEFTYSGEADSVRLAMIYSAARNVVNAQFFVEPGTINVALSDVPGKSRVGGTQCNDEWQKLLDQVMVIGKEINRIAEHIYGNTVTKEEQEQGMKEIDSYNERFTKMVIETAERNIDNEFGYFVLTYYPDEVINNETRLRLINMLPDQMRQRPAIKTIEASIAKAAKTAEGQTIPDFTQMAPDGSQLSIMSEVSQHKVTIIDFWASWCGPCRQEMPFMVELYNTHKDRGLGIVGISLDNDSQAWLQATEKLGITWPQMSDLKGWQNAAAQLFSITSIPHTIVVDQHGKILRRGLRGEELKKFIEGQLAS
jgi:thiol-disulfide isomerase/thioredoxin